MNLEQINKNDKTDKNVFDPASSNSINQTETRANLEKAKIKLAEEDAKKIELIRAQIKQTSSAPEFNQPPISEKLALLEKLHNIDYSPEEKNSFDNWLSQTQNTSIETASPINNLEEALQFLPPAGNYTDKKINLYFQKENLTTNDMQSLMESFSKNNPDFEISLVKNSDNLIAVGVGGKIRNASTTFDGEYFGHYHPTQFEFKNKESLPDCFNLGLMPSAGDIKGYLKHAEAVKNGTRIFSKNGYVLIKPLETVNKIDQNLNDYSEKYFDLFLNVNKLNLKTDAEVSDYFKKNFGLEITFKYIANNEQSNL